MCVCMCMYVFWGGVKVSEQRAEVCPLKPGFHMKAFVFVCVCTHALSHTHECRCRPVFLSLCVFASVRVHMFYILECLCVSICGLAKCMKCIKEEVCCLLVELRRSVFSF